MHHFRSIRLQPKSGGSYLNTGTTTVWTSLWFTYCQVRIHKRYPDTRSQATCTNSTRVLPRPESPLCDEIDRYFEMPRCPYTTNPLGEEISLKEAARSILFLHENWKTVGLKDVVLHPPSINNSKVDNPPPEDDIVIQSEHTVWSDFQTTYLFSFFVNSTSYIVELDHLAFNH